MAQSDITNPRSDTTGIAPTHVGFLLIPGFPMLSFATLLETLRATNTLSGKTLYRWSLVSVGEGAALASNGIEFKCDHQVGTDQPFDYLFVCAGGNPALFQDKPTLQWLRRLARQKMSLGGLSGGPYILARAGVLDGYRFTLHWEHAPAFVEDFPELDLRKSLYEIDRDRLTASGGASALDMMHVVISQAHGPELAIAVGEWFLQTQVREGAGPQRMKLRERLGVTNAPLLRAVERMEKSADELLTRDQLAKTAKVSIRQLERLFRRHLDCSLGDYYLQLRLQRGRDLLRQTSMSVLEIAVASGFVNASHFSRVYKQKYGHAPTAERNARRRERSSTLPSTDQDAPANT